MTKSLLALLVLGYGCVQMYALFVKEGNGLYAHLLFSALALSVLFKTGKAAISDLFYSKVIGLSINLVTFISSVIFIIAYFYITEVVIANGSFSGTVWGIRF